MDLRVWFLMDLEAMLSVTFLDRHSDWGLGD